MRPSEDLHKELRKDLGKITPEFGKGTFAYVEVRLSTERTNKIYIRCWSPEPELNRALSKVTALLKKYGRIGLTDWE